LRKAALISIAAGIVCLAVCALPASGQEPGGFGGRWSYGVSGTYSPTSGHILIGDARLRQVWTLGANYSHVLRPGPRFRFDYEASVMPVWEERDPAVIGTEFSVAGQAIVTPQTPVRVVNETSQPVGTILTGTGAFAPVYAIFGTENTYAAAVTPLGARVSMMPRWRVQPSFALDLGFVVGSRDLPVDNASQFNYTFALGPGIEFYSSDRTSWRVEYVYRHMSNAGEGNVNPGLDQAVLRVTVSRHR
jgi:hypothetical protein